jgi:lysozyme
MKYNASNFLDKLIDHEGMVLKVYQDSLGIDTIGIGRNLKDRGISKEELEYMDIPNMDAVYEHGISEADARYLALNDIKIVENELCRVHPCVEDLDAVRQLVLMDMAFNMGVPRLCKFKKMWNAIHEGQFEIASLEMMDSRWARQVGRRAGILFKAMKTGEF